MRKLYALLAAVLVAVSFGAGPAVASVDAPDSVSAPLHNETPLSFFSCGATRPDPDGPGGYTGADATVNHSHRIASKSSSGHYDWFDCEDYIHPGLDGCVWATYYIYDDDANGHDIGIFGPFNITCFGFD